MSHEQKGTEADWFRPGRRRGPRRTAAKQATARRLSLIQAFHPVVGALAGRAPGPGPNVGRSPSDGGLAARPNFRLLH